MIIQYDFNNSIDENIAQASFGDRLKLFQYFFINCYRNNCSKTNSLAQFESRQPVYLKLFGWDCQSECQLEAQWQTIDRLQNHETPQSIPQFYGKVRCNLKLWLS